MQMNDRVVQGCQMVYFQTKNSNLGKIFEGLKLEKIGIFYGRLESNIVNLYLYFTAT
jgi:hypothetical protein